MKIKIWFTDFWVDFDPYDNYFVTLLSKFFDIEITSSNPDFLIFSWVMKDFYNYKNCVRIFFTGENVRPDYSICDYSISFDYDSFDNRNLRLPLYVLYGNKEQLIKSSTPNEIANEKTKFCNFIYSNERASVRKDFFDLLNNYKRVDSGGKVFNNLGYRVPDKLQFIRDYKFTIAFENSSYLGYTTEKIFEPMTVNSIPIYWGNANVKEDFNTRSFVNVHEYGSLKEVVDRIVEIDKDEELYKKILAEPFINENKTTDYFSEERILNFFSRIFSERKITRHYYKLSDNNKGQQQPSISIIVPVYNTKEYLASCLNSILNQNFNNIEIICINDGSIDGSDLILQKYAENYPQIKVYMQDNQGLSAARNLGLKNATGEYILFVDSDDELLPDSLDKIYTKAQLMDTDILGFNYSDQNGNIRKVNAPTDEAKLLDGQAFYMLYYAANQDFPLSSSCLYLIRNDFVKKNNFQFKHGIYHEDEHFFLRIILKTDKIYYYNEPVYLYKMDREGSIMNDIKIKNAKDLLLIARETYYYFKQENVTEKLLYRKIFQMYYSAVLILSTKTKKQRDKIFSEEDKIIMKSCVQNYSNFYYSSLIAKDIVWFDRFVVKKRPFLISRIVFWTHKLYYFLFANKIRMKPLN